MRICTKNQKTSGRFPVIIAYLQERGINIGLAKRECRELRFMNADKPYFAIGFPNMAGGYEVRNKYFKGCVAPKDITHIRQQSEPRSVCYLFEGFMDYLSFLTIRVGSNPHPPTIGHAGLYHTEFRFQSCESRKHTGDLRPNRLFP